jgi:two-component system chemotaxis sensor kinase CheA
MDEIDYQFAEEDSPEKFAEKLREAFKDEAYELLAELENALLALEEDPGDLDVVNRIFRALHTIKGSGGSCGFEDIARFAHEVETFYDAIRSGKATVTKQVIDLTLTARDQIQALFDEYYNQRPADASKTQELICRFRELLPGASPAGARDQREQAAAPCPGQATYRIRFRPGPDFLAHGMYPVYFLDELRGLGHCTVVAQTDGIPYLEDFKPERCHTYWDAILTTDRGRDAIEDIFIFAKSVSELTVEVIDAHGCTDCDETTYKRLGDILLERGDLSPDDLQNALRSKKRLGETLVETGAVPPGKVESALAEQRHVREIREERRMNEETSSIRVSTGKLDDLVNLVGELVTVRARLSQLAFTQNSPQLLSVAEEVERLTGDLRDKTMSIRMLPIGTIFGKFQRLVRDLSSDLGKEVELVAEGAETELDKTVIERLGDPLVHLIRNSIDHGIEKPSERERAGKARRGTVRLSAVHSGGHVLIRIEDDGKGLDVHDVRAKAVERGLIAPDAAMSEQDLYSLVFSPGFSTAKTVTGVSGRGVGLDVVKKAIEALRGSIELQSKRGEGASITLKLPLTLAIIDGLLVRIGPERFVIPLALVKECVELSQQDRRNGHGRNIANVRGAILPYVDLRDRFGISGERPPIEQIVVTDSGGARTGFVVDGVIGGYQTVIKNLGTFYRGVEGVSGATILGDGTVALILDVPKLVQGAEREEADIVASSRGLEHFGT